MSRRRSVQDGDVHAVVHEIHHPRDQNAGVKRHGLTRLQVDLQAVSFLEIGYRCTQQIEVVVRPRDVVAAAEVHPLHPGQEFAETLLESSQGADQ